ncbi:ABC transporter permease [Anatilimnocola floriformis]|uniref:ABC transporter permease n=1 Tax=Anatilimnocola floriformis TaxID=2948575 RepID=UPI0020C39E16|nr:ABC transporter permease [Anatilimnocola floriformis]
MNLLVVAYRNLQRRRSRSTLTIAGIAIAVAAIVALVGVAESLESSFLSLYDRRGADLVVQRRNGAVQLSKGIPLALGEQIRGLEQTKEVIAGLMDMVAFEDAGLFMVIVNGWEPDCPVLDRVTLTKGRRLQVGDRRQVMLGRILAENLQKSVGDTIEIYAQPFEVVGIFESFSVFENGAVFMLLDELQRQMDRPGQVTGFVVQARQHGNPRAIQELRQKIEALDAEVAAVPCAEFVAGLSQMRVAHLMSQIVSAIALVIGASGVLNTMVISVLERRGELGALRAMGWPRRRVMMLIVTEAIMLASIASVLGIAVGTSVIWGLAHWQMTSNLVQGDLSLSAWLTGAFMALLMAVVGAIVPAYQAANVAPATAMRGL